MWAWGDNHYGQLGDGELGSTLTPVRVIGLDGVVTVSAGGYHSLAVRGDGTVWAWGSGYSEVHIGGHTPPMRVVGLDGVVAVAAGGTLNLALLRDGTVWAWGRNDTGQLGDGTVTDRTAPARVNGLSGVVAIAAGYDHGLAVKSDGSLWVWGGNDYGQLGDGTTTRSLVPVKARGMSGVVAVAAGPEFSLALKADGSAWAWGMNYTGQLGDGTTAFRDEPTEVSVVTRVTAIAAGEEHSLATSSDGTVWSWGNNSFGQLGDGSATHRAVPSALSGLAGVVAIAAGSFHSLAVTRDGVAYAWGKNEHGQLGDGSTVDRTEPVRVIELSDVVSVAAGREHSLAVKRDGTVWAWGENTFRELGDGTTADHNVPVKVAGLEDIVAVAGGGGPDWTAYSLALKRDGTVWAWGRNANGELGDGTTDERTTPVQVTGLGGIVAVAGGWRHSLAVKSDGTLWTWGVVSSGSWGDGVFEVHSTPVLVVGLDGVVAATAGREHSLAVKNDGTVWAWGGNRLCQLGDGSRTDRLTPVQGGRLRRVVAVAAGSTHSLAVESDGSVWAWGYDFYSQLGLGFTLFRTTPAQTLPTTPGGTHTISLSRSRLSFGAVQGATPVVTPAQDILLTESAPVRAPWSATADVSWLRLSRAADTGGAGLTIAIDALNLPEAGSYIGIVAIHSDGATNSPLRLPVTLAVRTSGAAPYGSFDAPANNATGLAGAVALSGWALDDVGVARVQLWRDPATPFAVPAYIGDALFVPDARPDVEAAYSDAPRSNRGGWGYTLLTNALPGGGNGTYRLFAVATDLEGHQTRLGTTTVAVDNTRATKPFGAIDTPAPGATISGAAYVNFGWALTPQPARIPVDGSTVRAFIDGVPVGTVNYNHPRIDIDTLFPGYGNTGGAVGFRSLDTTSLANGMHSIAWSVTDDHGNADGVGSRYFYIQNATVAASAAPGSPLAEQPAADQHRLPSVVRETQRYIQKSDVLSYRKGYDAGAPLTALRSGGASLLEPVDMEALERIEIHLPAAPAGMTWTGGLRVNGELRPLPVGSTLDEEDGVFWWQLGPGFLGEYQLEFSRPGTAPTVVRVRVLPKGSAGDPAIQ